MSPGRATGIGWPYRPFSSIIERSRIHPQGDRIESKDRSVAVNRRGIIAGTTA
jgi:hypothetical protein